MKNDTKKTRKKLNAVTVKLSDKEPGYEFKGKFLGFSDGQPFNQIDEKTGEIITKSLKLATFENNGERVAYIADKGLQDALTSSMVKEGQEIEVVKLDKVKLPKGRTMNQYDVYSV